jgi:hypothetical protein
VKVDAAPCGYARPFGHDLHPFVPWSLAGDLAGHA